MHHRSIVNWIDQSLFSMCPQSLSNSSLMKKYTRRKDKLKHNHTDTLRSTQKHKILTNNTHILYIYNQWQPWSLSQTWALQRLKLMIWCQISNTLHITSKHQWTVVTKNEYLIINNYQIPFTAVIGSSLTATRCRFTQIIEMHKNPYPCCTTSKLTFS